MLSFEGLGFFYASRDMLDAKASAKLASDAGASWACVLVESVDGRRQTPARIAAAVEALRAVDVAPALYTFPHPTKGVEGAERAAAAALANRIDTVVLDTEPFKGADWSTRSLAEAGAVITKAGLRCAWTTFPRARWGSVSFPPGTMLLQVYRTIRDADDTRAAVLRFPGRDVVLCVGTHLDDGGLEGDLDNVDAIAKTNGPRVRPSAGVWALGTTSKREAETLKAWAARGR